MNKSKQISKAVLTALSVAGIITVAVLAPNLFSVLGGYHKPIKKYDKEQVRKSFYRLKANDLLKIKYLPTGEIEIKVSKKGKQKLLKYKLDSIKLKKPIRWDRKWRIVIFDVPENMKSARMIFMSKLKEIGFVALQKSVFITPYSCEDEIDFIKEIYHIRNNVSLITAETIDNQTQYEKLFNL